MITQRSNNPNTLLGLSLGIWALGYLAIPGILLWGALSTGSAHAQQKRGIIQNPSASCYRYLPDEEDTEDAYAAVQLWTDYAYCEAQGLQAQGMAKNIQHVDQLWQQRMQRAMTNYQQIAYRIRANAKPAPSACLQWAAGPHTQCIRRFPWPTQEQIDRVLLGKYGFAWHLESQLAEMRNNPDTYQAITSPILNRIATEARTQVIHKIQRDWNEAKPKRNTHGYYVHDDDPEKFAFMPTRWLINALHKDSHRFTRAYRDYRRFLCEADQALPADTPPWLGPDCFGETGSARKHSHGVIAHATNGPRNARIGLQQAEKAAQMLAQAHPGAPDYQQCRRQAIRACLDNTPRPPAQACRAPC